MTAEALFQREGERYHPTECSLGPWGRAILHGGPVAALLAYAVERERSDAELLPARLSVDLFRAVPRAPLELRTRVLRDGKRLKVVEILLEAAGIAVSSAVGLLLRKSAEPDLGLAQAAGHLDPPEAMPPMRVPSEELSHATSLEIRGGVRPVTGQPSRGLWVRMPYPVVAGVELTPFTRTAAASDWTNPVGNYGPAGINFINADITLFLFREPEGEWLGLEPTARHSRDGVALSDCTVLDRTGPAGRCVTTSMATAYTASGAKPRG